MSNNGNGSISLKTPAVKVEIEDARHEIAQRWETWTPRRLREEEPEPVDWVIDGLMPSGLTLLVGAPKIGKSWLALQAALAVASGGKVLGSRDASAGRVLYLALEDNVARLQDRLETLEAAGGPVVDDDAPMTVIPRRGWRESGAEALERLDRWILAYPDTKLIVVDTLERIRCNRGVTGGGYSVDVAELDHLARLVDKGISVLALHHDRKAAGADALDRVSGTKGITGTADTIMILDRKRDNGRGELLATGRDVMDVKLALDLDDGLWKELGNAWEVQANATDQAIVEALRAAGGGPLKTAAIEQATGQASNSGLRVRLQRLVARGAIIKQGRGLYALPTGQEDIPF